VFVCVLGLTASAHEPAVAPVTVQIASDALDGASPYADWSDADRGPLPDEAARLEEIYPSQAEWINATFAGYPYRPAAHCRAGWPECIRPRAIPSNTPHYCGYYVGGGAAWWGEGRFLDEGTWGWDYVGPPYRKRIALDWWHGKPQGGTGRYQTDGPKILHHE
jgi:hypothetical protein